MTYLQPRSINVSGRRTTVRLEGAYWDELQRISSQTGQSVAQILSTIETDQNPSNFTSAIRVYILTSLRAEHEKVRSALAIGRRAPPRPQRPAQLLTQ